MSFKFLLINHLNVTEQELLTQELEKLDELLVEQKVTALLGDCCSYEGENEYDIGHKYGGKSFLKVQILSVTVTWVTSP